MKDINTRHDFAELPHILVIDDDRRIRTLVSRYLWERDFFPCSAANSQEAEEILKVFEFDALVVDVMMPEKSGVEFVSDLRRRSDIPVIMLTARGEIEDKISGLESGADDYLAKPFDPRELVLRLKSIMKRHQVPGSAEHEGEVKIGKMLFDQKGKLLVIDGKEVPLTDMEATLLGVLVKKSGEVLDRERLASLCGSGTSERAVDVQITRLRKKMGEDGKNPKHLQTVRGKGYLLRT